MTASMISFSKQINFPFTEIELKFGHFGCKTSGWLVAVDYIS